MSTLPVLLLVFPGYCGRRPVLEQACKLARVVSFLHAKDTEKFAWAKELSSYWIVQDVIETPDCDAFAASWLSVKNFLEQNNIKIDGVLCYDEYGVELAAYFCEKLGIVSTPLSTVQRCRNKFLFRLNSSQHNLPTPTFIHIPIETTDLLQLPQLLTFPFPAVLKPAKGAGSWNIRKISNLTELQTLFPQHKQNFLNSPFPSNIKQEGFLLEAYFGGVEIDVDGFCSNGELQFCLISDNSPATEPFFLEQGGTYPSTKLDSAATNQVLLTLKSLFKVFHNIHGVFHFEAKVQFPNDKEKEEGEEVIVMPLELNLRVGGAECPASVLAVTGVHMPTIAIKLSLGLDWKQNFTFVDNNKMYYEPELLNYLKTKPQTTRPKLSKCVCSTNLFAPKQGVLKYLGSSKLNKVIFDSDSNSDVVFPKSLLDKNEKKKQKQNKGESDKEEKKEEEDKEGEENKLVETGLVQFMLFEESVGKEVVINDGSRGCLGWIAASGNTEEEAKERLKKLIDMVDMEIETKNENE